MIMMSHNRFMNLSAQTFKKGFTLIELLVVIAVIGVLATIVLLAVNPAEQLARGRDTSRQSAITQIGRALQSYYTVQSPAAYPALTTASFDSLVTAGDMKTVPVNPAYSTAPTVNCAAANLQSTTTPASNYCYMLDATGVNAIVYGRMESALNNNKCAATSNIAWFVFSSALGRAGVFCKATAPAQADITSTMVLL